LIGYLVLLRVSRKLVRPFDDNAEVDATEAG
jgi:hypothetical protein